MRPGDIGSIVFLHGYLYAEECGFDYTFDAYVAEPIAKFVKRSTQRERIWIVEKEGQIMGSTAVVRFSEKEAQLRWLLLHPKLRGYGLGKLLLKEAVNFCMEQGYQQIFLWTVSTLIPAINLYRSFGFKKTESETHKRWGRVVTEERYDLKLKV